MKHVVVVVRLEMRDDVRFGDLKKYIYTCIQNVYVCVCVYIYIYIYIWGLSVSLLKWREKLWYRHRRLPPVYCRRIIKNPAEFSAR